MTMEMTPEEALPSLRRESRAADELLPTGWLVKATCGCENVSLGEPTAAGSPTPMRGVVVAIVTPAGPVAVMSRISISLRTSPVATGRNTTSARQVPPGGRTLVQ